MQDELLGGAAWIKLKPGELKHEDQARIFDALHACTGYEDVKQAKRQTGK